MNPTTPLASYRLLGATPIAAIEPRPAPAVTLGSPAITVMTDLTQVKAATTHPDASLARAEQAMIHQGVRMLFVVSELPSILGLITTTDLRGDRALRIVNERRLHHDELTVADVMTSLAELDAVDFDSLRTASVSNLVATLQRVGRNHLLVMEAGSAQAPQRVRGVISRSQIERQLGSTIELTEIASSFAEIERALV
jgi:signal-transduction protein with cAMP-binding, CBS, and nucleotidyltransferase domain